MDETDFEDTLVLEKLGQIGKVDAFFEAVDSDDFESAKKLMLKAKVDSKTIQIVLRKMANGEE